MSEEPEVYTRKDQFTGETTERVVYTESDRVAAEFAGYSAPAKRGGSSHSNSSHSSSKTSDKS